MKLVYAGVAWLLGLWLSHVTHIPAQTWLLVGLAMTLGALLLRRKLGAVFLLCASVACFAGWRYQASLPRIGEGHLAWYNDQGVVTVQGLVAGEPEPYDGRWRARIEAQAVWHPRGYASVVGDFVAVLPAYPVVHDGDLVRVRGELVTPPVWDDFSYKDYLARQGVHSVLQYPSLEVLSRAERRDFRWALSALRTRAEATIGALLPEPEASLLSGILLNRDAGIPDDVMSDFRVTGTAHIIAISGFNITIIAGLLAQLLRRAVGKKWAVVGVIPGVALYAMLVGGDAPVVRAAIMGCLSLVALQLGRRSDALTALLLSALAMTALRPQTLWDVGFQLSFAATLGLILYVTPLQKGLEAFVSARVPTAWANTALGWLNEGLVVTVAAQILTLPLTVAYFRNLSPFSLLANLLILPAQPYVMTWGGSALLLGLIWLPLGLPLASVAWLFLTYTIRVAGWLASLPGASMQVARVPVLMPVAYYAVVAALTVSWARANSRIRHAAGRLKEALTAWRLVAAVGFAAALVWAAAVQMPDGRLHVHFLDVGEGDAILIRTPSGRTVVVDGGTDPARLLSEVGRRLPFWERSIDLVALSHPDADHVGGLAGLLNRYRVGLFLDARPGKTPEYKACMAAVEAKGVEHVAAEPGQRFLLDSNVTLEVLYPSEDTPCESTNDCSMVLLLTMGRATFLFPGGLEMMGQVALLNEVSLSPCLVLKSPHHGSEGALFDAFWESLSPAVVVIQPGPRAAADPSPVTLLKVKVLGASLWQTRQQGSLEIVTDGERYWMKF